MERDTAPFNYEEADNELRKLQQIIAEVTGGDKKEPPDALVMRSVQPEEVEHIILVEQHGFRRIE